MIRKITAILTFTFGIGAAATSANAAFNEIWHSKYEGSYGSIVVHCSGDRPGGPIAPASSSTIYCQNTDLIRPALGSAGIKCYVNGQWMPYGRGTSIAITGPGFLNCRTYYAP